ncbi:hypothetical protein [Variovorax sp. OV329]|uniref:hypothetical protein n=1 Tax=Variovorax sp. OV329 TaxID=1882825 RepID=UPI0008E85B14|nr:hypothetical protein [Variovorax sp. OV329]SFM62177.1 hypothetical protein SAMN05444747_10722 [Variovorax sp. OV329]
MEIASRPLALVTGASSGIGFHLARLAAQRGYEADVVAGLKNKMAVAILGLPSQVTAEQHRKLAEPGTARN